MHMARLTPSETQAQLLSGSWEVQRHAHEVAYWAERLDEFAKRLPQIRLNRGADRAERLKRDVIAAIKAARGEDAGVLARDRLNDVWRWAEQRRRP